MARYVGKSDDILLVRFTGKNLDSSSIPIYELGSTLLAIQRVVNKAALDAEGRLEKGILLPPKERERLALQISSHRKGSDLWGFAPYLVDPAIGPILRPLIVAGVIAIGAYAWKKISPDKPQPPENKLVVHIYPDVKQIVDRINNIGGIDRIEISQPLENDQDPVVIDADTQQYVRELEFQLVPGKKMIISGVVTRIHPQSYRLDIQDAPGHYVHVSLDPKDFERVRRLSALWGREIRFEGIPMYRVGDSGGGIQEFRAERVIYPRNRD